MNEQNVKITPELVLETAKRRRWVILIPLTLSIIVGIYMAIVLPKVYEARTLILIEPQRVPQNYVQSIVTEAPGERINTIAQQIMSRTNLEKIISDFGLFAEPERANMYMEDKVDSLRKRISVDVIQDRRGADAFTIQYRDSEPIRVMKVANGLAMYFINENIKVRETQASGTSEFLEAELESMRVRLEQLEEKIKEYRRTNMGELPEQLETNLRILDRLQETLTDRQEGLRQARMRLADLNAQAAIRPQQVFVIGGDGSAGGGRSIQDLKSELENMRSRYTQEHPDIIRLKKMIAEMEANQQDGGPSENGLDNLPQPLRRQIFEVRNEIQLIEREIDKSKLQIADYERRIEVTPKREQELLSLRRDYQNIQASYDSLLARKLEADIAVNMERKQKGEQFRIIDPARQPERPVEPNMLKLFAIVMLAGLGLGGGGAFLLEYFNSTFRKADEIENFLHVPVLATIPGLLSKKKLLLVRLNNICSVAFLAVAVGLMGIFGFICARGPELAMSVVK